MTTMTNELPEEERVGYLSAIGLIVVRMQSEELESARATEHQRTLSALRLAGLDGKTAHEIIVLADKLDDQ